MKTIFISFLFLAVAASSFAQAPDTLWTRTYGGVSYEEAYDLKVVPDGGFIAVGRSCNASNWCDFYLVRINSLGDTLWTRKYGGPDYEEAWAVDNTLDGGLVVAGYGGSDPNDSTTAMLMKTDATGNVVWARAFGGLGVARAHDIRQTADGGFIVVGQTKTSVSGIYCYVLKTDAWGDSSWSIVWRTTSGQVLYGIRELLDGGFIAVGFTQGLYGGSTIRCLLLRLSPSGSVLWSREYGQGGEVGYDVQQTSDHGFIVAGETYYGYVLRVDSIGIEMWHHVYTSLGETRLFSIDQTDDNGFVLGGFTYRQSNERADCYVLKIDQSGDTVWTKTIGGSSDDYAMSIQKVEMGGYVVGGSTMSYGAGSSDFYVVRIGLDVPLPVSLISFSALSSLEGIRITFSTASETNNDYFEIMRGASEAGAFARIATLPSQGNSATGHHYEYLDRAVAAGQTYWYYLADVDLSGNRTEHRELMQSATMSGSAELPSDYSLSAYPNPFNPSTTISFALPEADVVRIAVFDVSGRWVQTLVNEQRGEGNHTVIFNARDLPSGVYFARMESGQFAMTRKMLLIR